MSQNDDRTPEPAPVLEPDPNIIVPEIHEGADRAVWGGAERSPDE